MPPERRILVVGTGSIGLKHLRAFLSLDSPPSLTAIDPSPAARGRAAEMGVRVLDTDWDSADLTDFDGVVLCVPPPLHVPYASRLLAAGVPVLSEKPLSGGWDGVEDLVRRSEEDGAPHSGVAYVRRCIGVHAETRRMVERGDFGPILVVRVSSGQPFPRCRPDYRSIYYAKRETGGGCVLDFASHFLDLAQWLAGPIRSVRGYSGRLALDGVEVEDTAVVSFDLESDGLGALSVNQFQPVNENVIDLCGPEACVRILEPGFTCRVWRRHATEWETLKTRSGDYAEGLAAQAAAFLAAIDGGPPMRTGIAEAAHTLRLCLDLLEQSSPEKRRGG